MLELIVAFLCGAALTGILLFVGFFVWFNSQPVIDNTAITKGFEPFVRPQLPQYLEEVFSDLNSPDGTGVSVESCCWVNLVSDFLFRELRDSTLVKRILMKKINNEFEELLLTRTEGRMLEQLTVRDYFLGTSMPIIKDMSIVKIECSPDDDKKPEEIELAMHIDYSGGVEMKIDADLIFDKSAYVAVTVLSLKGRLRVRFSRLPSTHWSFSFYEEPEIKLRVDSHFEGRSFPKLSSLIESQIRRFVRKKYVIPSAKMRHKPFFKKPKPQDQLMEVYVKDEKLTVGELQVQVVDCSRLVVVESATKTYCTLALGRSPYQPRVNLWRTLWPTHELVVTKDPQKKIGIHYKQVSPVGDRSNMIVVDRVFPHTAAMTAGILNGDVLLRINNVRVSSVKQVEKLIQKTRGSSVLVTLQRPPPHFNPLASAPVHPSRSSVRSGDSVQLTEEWESLEQPEALSDAEGLSMRSRTLDSDSISLCDVRGERRLMTQDEGLRRRTNTMTSIERRSATPELAEVRETSTPTDPQPSSLGGLEPAPIEPSLQQPQVRRPAETTLSGSQSHESDIQQVTREVPMRKNPSWGECFDFNITKEHNYLNVCVWTKLSEESGDLLIGHVTIPLMDIAMECLCTSSGYHHQRFVLVAAQTLKPSASRATLQAKSSVPGNPGKDGGKKKKWESVFAGDIFLRFKHCPNPNTEQSEDTMQEDPPAEDNDSLHKPQSFPSHPFTASEGHLPKDHDFSEAQDTDGRKVCDICGKKIWSLKSKPMKCKNCGLKCHKKCASYCILEVPCKSDGRTSPRIPLSSAQAFPRRLKQRMDGEFTVLEADEDEGPVDKAGGNGGHRWLQQQSPSATRTKASLSSSFEVVGDSKDADKDNPDGAFVILESSNKDEREISSTNSTKGEENVAKDERVSGDSLLTRDKHEGGSSLVTSHEGGSSLVTSHEGSSLVTSHEGGRSLVTSHEGGSSLVTSHEGGSSIVTSHEGGRSLVTLHEGGSSLVTSHDHTVDSSDESAQLYTPPPEDSGDSSVEEEFISSQYRLSSRKARHVILESMDQERVINEIADKQIEIDQYTELVNTTSVALKDPNLSCSEEEELRAKLADCEERIRSLTVSMSTKLQVAHGFL